MSAEGNAKICDFNSCRRLKNDERAYSDCGTKEYSAPEIFTESGFGFEVDYWALGVSVFNMLKYPKFPFRKENGRILNYELPDFNQPNTSNNMFTSIQKTFKKEEKNIITGVTCDFISKLLTNDPSKRLGSIKNSERIREHPFFGSINWTRLENGQIKPPTIPKIVISLINYNK